jgi:hypothetical protein
MAAHVQPAGARERGRRATKGPKPKLRGVSHLLAAAVALVAGAALIREAPTADAATACKARAAALRSGPRLCLQLGECDWGTGIRFQIGTKCPVLRAK